MEDFVKFILIAGVIIVGIVREVNKSKSKKSQAERLPPSMSPEVEPLPDAVPASDVWGKMFTPQDFFEPTPIENTTKKPSPKQKNSNNQRPIEQKKGAYVALPSTPDAPQEVLTMLDFTIHSEEEARRAIVWGEILRRKY